MLNLLLNATFENPGMTVNVYEHEHSTQNFLGVQNVKIKIPF